MQCAPLSSRGPAGAPTEDALLRPIAVAQGRSRKPASSYAHRPRCDLTSPAQHPFAAADRERQEELAAFLASTPTRNLEDACSVLRRHSCALATGTAGHDRTTSRASS